MTDELQLERRAVHAPPKFWPKQSALPDPSESLMKARRVPVRPARYSTAAILAGAFDGEVDGRVGRKRFEGYVAELDRDDTGQVNASPAGVRAVTVEFLELPSGPTWIAVWTPEEWKDHPLGTPSIGDTVAVTSWWASDARGKPTPKHEIKWTPRKLEPWSEELLARLRSP